MNKAFYCYLVFMVLFFSACGRQLDFVVSTDDLRESEGQLSSFEGIMEAVNGNYILLRNNNPDLLAFSELRGNTVRMTRSNYEKYFSVFNYEQDPDFPILDDYWKDAYALVIACNNVLEGMERFEKSTEFVNLSSRQEALLLHAKGETLFLRGYTYFNLVKLFGRPYHQRPQVNPGVIIKNNTDINFIPGRSTVSEVYAQIIKDLKGADSIMTADVGRANVYAGREAAWALLSRVYLYMGGAFGAPDRDANQQALLYADKVINAGKFQLLEGKAYDTLYNREQGNPEIIFASTYKDRNNDISAGIGYGGLKAANSLVQAFMPDDYRRHFFGKIPSTQETVTVKYKSISPFIHLRLAEAYLNKAEALFKMGSTVQALDALNVIHTRAGLPALSYSDRAQLQRDIMRERRLELCFEGHTGFDDYRNGLPMIRPAIDSGVILEVLPTDKRVVLLIPQSEMDANPRMVQNEK